jgi:hypothetical protein
MASKQRKAADEFTETFPPDTVQQWRRMVREWEANSSRPNPYVSKDRGRLFCCIPSPTAHSCFISVESLRNSVTARPGRGCRGRKGSTSTPSGHCISLHQNGAGARRPAVGLRSTNLFYALIFEQAHTVISIRWENTVKCSESESP